MTAGMMRRRFEYQDYLYPHFPFRMSDSVSNATTTQPEKSSHMAVAGPTQFSKEMFNPPPPPGPSAAPVPLLLLVPIRSSRQDQLAEVRMQMMHMQSKKKELELRAEMFSVVLCELFCDKSDHFKSLRLVHYEE
jgi:hypothetical protein